MRKFLDWAVDHGEGSNTIRAIRRIPARLDMPDGGLLALPEGLVHFERKIAGTGYRVFKRAKDRDVAGRCEDSRIRAALRRYHSRTAPLLPDDRSVRDRYETLIGLIAAEEGLPGSGARWSVGCHRSLIILRARARCAPEALTQAEIDRIGRGMPRDQRKAFGKAVTFINSLRGAVGDLPAIRACLPDSDLKPPRTSAQRCPHTGGSA